MGSSGGAGQPGSGEPKGWEDELWWESKQLDTPWRLYPYSLIRLASDWLAKLPSVWKQSIGGATRGGVMSGRRRSEKPTGASRVSCEEVPDVEMTHSLCGTLSVHVWFGFDRSVIHYILNKNLSNLCRAHGGYQWHQNRADTRLRRCNQQWFVKHDDGTCEPKYTFLTNKWIIRPNFTVWCLMFSVTTL